jgi:hypothetical protein
MVTGETHTEVCVSVGTVMVRGETKLHEIVTIVEPQRGGRQKVTKL